MLRKGKKLHLGSKRYEIGPQIGQGGSGIVYRVMEAGTPYALKVFFPYYQLPLFQNRTTDAGRSINESIEFQRREHSFLARLDHPNIVKVYDAGMLRLTVAEAKRLPLRDVRMLPYLIMDFVDGMPLKETLEEGVSAEQIEFVLQRLAKALEYLHADRHYMHVDIKSNNILVRKQDFEPILIDFALCKNLNFLEVDPQEPTRLLGDWDLFPRELSTDHRLKAIRESDGPRQELFDLAFPGLDLFQFGKLLKGILPQLSLVLDERDTAYLADLADQLTHWAVVSKWGPNDLLPKITRLGAEHFAPFGVPELVPSTAAEKTIMIPPGLAVPTTKYVDRLLNTRSFRRLTHINQLCLLCYVYPAADYKRAVHVLYSFELSRQFVAHLYGSSVFRMLFDPRSTRQLLTLSLLHDINHFPFLHIFQESGIPGLNRVDVVDLFCKGEATGELASQQPSVYDLLADVGIDAERFKRLVFGKHHEQSGQSVEIDQTISSLLNSGVDVDKLSYLQLDAYFTGVRYGGGIDLPALLKSAVVGRLKAGERPLHLAFDEMAVQALENVVMTRFWNFRALYWHHTNRAIMAMILHVVRKLYMDQARNVHDYLLDNLWSNDVEAVRYLDERYRSQFGQSSVLGGLTKDRRRLYRRLYTVQAGLRDLADDDIQSKLRRLEYRNEVRFRRALAVGLTGLLGNFLPRGSVIGEDEVLFDVPRREMDSGGTVYVETAGRDLEPLSSISDPVRAINANYERLTKRARIFVAPRIAENLGAEWRLRHRKEIQTLVLEALDVAEIGSQVR